MDVFASLQVQIRVSLVREQNQLSCPQPTSQLNRLACRPFRAMAAVKKFAVAVLLLSLLVFVFLFGQVPALRRVPVYSTRVSGVTDTTTGGVL